jgi:hypothetical protein
MKTFKILLAVVAIAAFSRPASATDKVVVNNYKNTNYAIVSASLPFADKFSVTIKNSTGDMLYNAKVSNNAVAFQKLFDLSNLEDGKYSILFNGEGQSFVSYFEIRNSELISSKSDAGITVSSANISSSYMKQKNDIIYVSHINPELNRSSIEIFDNRGDSIYSADLPVQGTYSGAYKINDLPKGDYVMVLTSGNNTKSYEFQK